MNVLSLFDGMSCGQQALERQGIKVDTYYASEIDKHAIKITQKNYPNTIQLGSVVNVDITKLDRIDMLIGGSPCQSFSFAGERKGMSTKDEIEILTLDQYLELKEQNFDFEGQSYLFWEYMRILTDIRKTNPNVKFLLENVLMGEKWEKVLSRAIGVNPIEINSAVVSAQNRRRLYWTNIGMKPAGLFGYLESTVEQPKDRGILLKDILESEVDEKYFLKEKTLSYFIRNNQKQIEDGNGYRFQPTEGDKKADTLTNKPGSRMQDNFVKSKVIQLNEAQEFGGQPRQQNRVYSTEGLSPCLTVGNQGGGCTPKILLSEATKKGYVEIEPGECFDFENPNSETRRGRKMEDNSNCLMAKETDFMHYTKDYRIRRLTPKECERLQTVKDGYTEGVSDTQRYRMLGNGWTIEVISHILSYLEPF